MAGLIFLILWVGGAHLTGHIAKKKGHGYVFFFIAALLMMIIALPMALLMKPVDEALCPHCKSLFAKGATVCANCTRDLYPADVEQHHV